MSDDLIERLRAGLVGVTPGPWSAVQMDMINKDLDRPCVVGPSDIVVGNDGICEPDRYNDRMFTEDAANMRHIANCSPDNIRTLLDALAAKDTALSDATGRIDTLKEAVSSYSQVISFKERQVDDATAALSEMRAELERVKTYAHEATRTLTDLVGGGSECFAGRIGEMYIADLPYCKRRIRERESRAHEQLLKAVAAARALAPSIQDTPDLGARG
ncbi:FliJ family protein [Mesorhizobium sp. B2-1-3A]|uniref:FliJ family protein n=1 Tax=Mesorhizobium sp. B2-1-3A TaxID=2589971 RepID=UPI00112CCFF7|nr:FliJ family protein [Mesorhizobium sp. B2-1-3A]TPM89826.1 hypothetical protein FJ977_35175 [Mesorhizobium sp. B2-1-3A]